MSAVKHTPGPWCLGADMEGVITDYRNENGSMAPDNYLKGGWAKTVCKIKHASWLDIEESVANGRVIAAAPDMLESLKELCDRLGPQWFLAEGWAGPLDAIAKAEGREASE